MLAIGKEDNVVSSLANGCNAQFISGHADLQDYPSTEAVIFRSMTKKKVVDACKEQSRDYYYIDTGYFGNFYTDKQWHRVVKNGMQHSNPRFDLPNDRFKRMCTGNPHISFTDWKKDGRAILLVVPSEKPCKFYGIDRAEWVKDTVNNIQQYTDRPIVIREKQKARRDRIGKKSIYHQFYADNIFAVVTYNSIASVEAIGYRLPVFTMAPNVADCLCLKDLSKIESPYYPDKDKVVAWQNWLGYCQYSTKEMANGTAIDLIEQFDLS